MSFTALQARAELELRHRRQVRTVLPLYDWTQRRRERLKPGVPVDFEQHKYLRDVYQDNSRRLVIYKAGQMGASEYLISYALHACDQRSATTLYVFPTDTAVSDFSSARLGPALEASPYLERIVIDSTGASGKRGADRVTLKRVRDRFLYFRGAKVTKNGRASQLKSVDADVLILDEVDEMDPRAPSIAVKRLDASRIKEERWVSTPSYPGVGIHQKWLTTDQREWHIRCQRCQHWQFLTINHVVMEWDDLERPVAWHGMGDGEAWPACEKCGAKLDRLADGEWVATHPKRDITGYHLTHLFGPRVNLLEIIQNLQTTDETKRKETYNQDLGEPYRPRGGGLDDEILDACRRDYGHVPVDGERTVMGVDVGKVLNVVIRGPAKSNGERSQRWAGEVGAFDEVSRLMRRFNVGVCVVDALPETRKAREFQADWPKARVWLAYYVDTAKGSKKSEPTDWREDEGVVNLDRTRTLDETFTRFFEQSNTLPAHIAGIGDYYAQMKSLIRVTEKNTKGEIIARYVDTGPDHYAHAENYAMAAEKAPRRPPGVIAQGRTSGWGIR